MLLSVFLKVMHARWDNSTPPSSSFLITPLPPCGAEMSADERASGVSDSRAEPAQSWRE